jgi:hypothetical protein
VLETDSTCFAYGLSVMVNIQVNLAKLSSASKLQQYN